MQLWSRIVKIENDLATLDQLLFRKFRKNTSFFCNVTQKKLQSI